MWKEIPNTDGLYLISEDGKVFSTRSNRILKNQQLGNGYWRIELNIDGKYERRFIHRLVAEAFIPNPNNYPCVNHKDENPSNNHVSNLEWCTHKYNMNYGTRTARMNAHRVIPKGADNPQSIRVYQFSLDGEFLAEYGSCGEAGRETGLRSSSIARAVNGSRKQYAGYYWSDKKEFEYSNVRDQRFKKGAILKCDMEGNVLKQYNSSLQLKSDGYNQIHVNRVCRGERKSYKGFTWKHERNDQ